MTETSSFDGSPSTTTPTVGFLGPRGTFTEQALQTQPDLTLGNLITLSTMPDVLFAVEDNTLDAFVKLLRQKVDGKRGPPLIHTARGVGYCIRAEP